MNAAALHYPFGLHSKKRKRRKKRLRITVRNRPELPQKWKLQSRQKKYRRKNASRSGKKKSPLRLFLRLEMHPAEIQEADSRAVCLRTKGNGEAVISEALRNLMIRTSYTEEILMKNPCRLQILPGKWVKSAYMVKLFCMTSVRSGMKRPF